jgi:hypothetical protein
MTERRCCSGKVLCIAGGSANESDYQFLLAQEPDLIRPGSRTTALNSKVAISRETQKRVKRTELNACCDILAPAIIDTGNDVRISIWQVWIELIAGKSHTHLLNPSCPFNPFQEKYGMKRIAQCFLALVFMASGCIVSANAQTACTRDGLKGIIGQYFTALEERNPSSLPLAAKVKFTENGVEMPVGEGLWKTAGKVLLKWDLLDTNKCGTHSTVVIEEKYTAPKTAEPAPKSPFAGLSAKPPADGTIRPILYGARLKIENQQITEIETFVARETEFAFNAATVLEHKDQDWESIIPEEQRSSRLAMIAAADDYFDMFVETPKVRTPFTEVCDRWENGFHTTRGGGQMGGVMMTAHDCSPKGLVITNHGPRRFLVDLEAGTVVAYVHFASSLPDFHVFRMRNGKVDLIQSVIGAGAKSMGWPDEPVCK